MQVIARGESWSYEREINAPEEKEENYSDPRFGYQSRPTTTA